MAFFKNYIPEFTWRGWRNHKRTQSV